MIDRLDVSLRFRAGAPAQFMGQLGRDPQRRGFAFEWDRDFANAPLPVWPVRAKNLTGLLRSSDQRPRNLPGLFEDSLPDGWGQLLLDREIRAAGAGRSDMDDVHRLAFVGDHGMGALTYAPSTAPEGVAGVDLGWFEGLMSQIDEVVDIDALRRLRAMSGGSQGARPKFVAMLGPDGQALCDHRAPWAPGWTHVLIKGRGSMDPRGAIEAELAYGDLMRRAGIDTRPMQALYGDSETFFCTERFDREGASRLHMASVAGMLDTGLHHGVFDYVELMRLAKAVCAHKARTAEEIFRRMVFNVRTISRDDHIRNHAFLMDDTGQWRLAPAYDVTFDPGPGGEHSMAIAGEGRAPGLTAFAEVARVGGIRPRRRDEIVAEVANALNDWSEVANAHQVPPTMRDDIARQMHEARSWR